MPWGKRGTESATSPMRVPENMARLRFRLCDPAAQPGASERYAQLLANRALEREVAAVVLELHSIAGGDRDAVAQAIRHRFGSDAARRRAALKVLARMK